MSHPSTPNAIDHKAWSDFDDQGWPVNALLVTAAGASAAAIAYQGNFVTEDIWHNAWVHLALLGAWTVTTMVVASLFRGWVQRRMQLAILVSLIAHLVMTLGMQHVYFATRTSLSEGAAPTPYQPVLMPDYHASDIPDTTSAEQEMFSRPVETPVARPIESADRESKLAEAQTRTRATPTPMQIERQPTPTELARAEISTPRRADRVEQPERTQPTTAPAPRPLPNERVRPLSTSSNQATPRPERAQREAAAAEARAQMAQLNVRATSAPNPQALDRQATNRPTPQLQVATLDSRSRAQPQAVEIPQAAAPAANNSQQQSPDVKPAGAAGRSSARVAQPGALAGASEANSPSVQTAPSISATPSTSLARGAPVADPTPTTAGAALRRAAAPGQTVVAQSQERVPSTFGQPGVTGSQAGSPGVAMANSGMQRAGQLDASTLGAGQRTGSAGQPVAGVNAGLPSAVAGGADTTYDAQGTGIPNSSATGMSGVVGSAVAAGPARTSANETSLGAADAGSGNGSALATNVLPRQAAGGGMAGGVDVPRVAEAAPSMPSGGGGAVSGTGREPLGPAISGAGRATESSAVADAPSLGALASSTPARGAGGEGGGLALPTGADSGLPLRRARPEADLVHAMTPRLILEKSGGRQAVDAHVRDTAVEGLKQRDRQSRATIAEQRGGSAGTEAAVELGLEFLARHQSADGSWSLHAFHVGRGYDDPGPAIMQSETAGTGLALLAFLGAGYTHTDGKYREVVERALDYLVTHQKADGDLFVPTDNRSNQNVWLYSHGIASIALCEAYGMTRDPQLRSPAQRALQFIVEAQHPTDGGWRYAPRQGSDTSVSGWQVMALKSGELAGLTVPQQTYQKLMHWLDVAMGAGGDPSRYAYRPRSQQRDQREPSRVMTAEALLMRQYLGWRRNRQEMIGGANWLHVQLPTFGSATTDRPWGQRDAYYWYYATQVMFQMQGTYWEDWNREMHTLLVNTQERDGGLAGSWNPNRPVPDRWGEYGGRIYVTTLHLLMLEVYYRHLPIYQTLDEPSP